MKALSIITICLWLPFAARAELAVFACEPEWAALADEIGGTLVDASSATSARQDPHYIQARPSLIAKVRRADLVICSGAGLEVGWLPMLLLKANNPDVQPGNEGFMEASAFVPRLEVPASVDRALGDAHPQGNPHVQMDPNNIARIADALAARFVTLDVEHADAYRVNLTSFRARWDQALAGWERRAAPLRGKRIIVHHKSWVYLAAWLRLEEVATLEPVPGIPPSAAHLATLVRRFGEGGADFIVRAPYQDAKASDWLTERTGIPPIMLPLTVGGSDAATDLFGLFDDVLDRLLGAGS